MKNSSSPDATSVDASSGAGADESPTASLEAMIARAGHAGEGLPPVDRWNPDYCGELDMRIQADGTWFYQGTPIGRERLVRLFSTVLRRDEDGHTYLVTPVEKVRIEVEDAPFLGVEMTRTGEDAEQVLTFRTNVGDVVEAGPDHPLRFEREDGTDGVKPYLLVRGRLEALVNRAVTYDLIELGEPDGDDFVVRSNGAAFRIAPAADTRV